VFVSPVRLVVVLLLGLTVTVSARTDGGRRFIVEETTIAQVHAGFLTGNLTCLGLVTSYLNRIERFDQDGPALNAIASTNPQAMAEAHRLDRDFAERGLTGPLHCVPVIVKDNIETAGWETTAGSLALKGFLPERDAAAITKLKQAGALILAKGNMPDFALNVLTTVNLIRGATQNPYALDRVPAGSSGGTAVAVAANLGLVGLGTDTGGSVRGPAAHLSLVGMRPTMGLSSRAGIVPLDANSDVVGPLTRTVEDMAIVLDVLTGWDPNDASTEAVQRLGSLPTSQSTLAEGLDGMRIGILSQAYLGGPLKIDPQVARLFARALTDLSSLGVEIVDTVALTPIQPLPEMEHCQGLKYDLNAYLAQQGDRVPVHSLQEIIASGRYHPSIEQDLLAMQASPQQGPGSKACDASAAYRASVAAAMTAAMDRLDLDALVYPTWSQQPQRTNHIDPLGAGQTLRFATAAGFPALSIPMGFTTEVLPSGLSLLGRKWADAHLLRVAYAYEQATRHRRPPVLAPPIPCECHIR
jgi:Asp-tRNA(Asn)/Glu-tRNA(Gln) amidotransferase A subunit family amidase